MLRAKDQGEPRLPSRRTVNDLMYHANTYGGMRLLHPWFPADVTYREYGMGLEIGTYRGNTILKR